LPYPGFEPETFGFQVGNTTNHAIEVKMMVTVIISLFLKLIHKREKYAVQVPFSVSLIINFQVLSNPAHSKAPELHVDRFTIAKTN
jgi:hypothetical protein